MHADTSDDLSPMCNGNHGVGQAMTRVGAPGSPLASEIPVAIRKASRVTRFMAALVDLVMICILLIGSVQTGMRGWWFAVFASMWLVYLEVGYRCGGSFGKLLLGLRVTVPNRRTYFFREIIGYVAVASVATPRCWFR